MKRFFFWATFVSIAGLTSCDPGQTLLLKAAPSGNCFVAIFGNGKILPGSRDSSAERVVIRVPETAGAQVFQRYLTYRIGSWRGSAIGNLARNIDSIVVGNNGTISRFARYPEIVSFLRSNLKTSWTDNLIVIEAGGNDNR